MTHDRPLPPDFNTRVDALFARWTRPDSPGASVRVLRHGREIHRGCYGMADLAHGVPIDERTVIRIGSQTKQFTVLLALMLEAEGKLSMQDDVRRHLPWLPDFPETVTLRHLAANVGGLRDFLEIMTLGGLDIGAPSTRAGARRIIAGHKAVNFRPGESLIYCNTGFFLLSEIVEQVSGKSFNALLEDRITGPLGMRDTRLMRWDSEILPRLADHHTRGPDGGWHKAQWGVVLGGEGGMVSTLEDMTLWLANLDAPKVGTPEMIARMSAPGAAIDGIPSPYGLGLVTCRYRGLSSIGHGGGVAGGRSESVRFPEAGIGVVILGNTDDMGPFSLARRILDLALGEEVGPPRTTAATERLTRAVGLYRAEGGDDVFGVALKDGQPVFVSNMNSGMPIEQVGDGAFMPERGIVPLEFTPRDDGDVDTRWFGRPQRFRRLSDTALPIAPGLAGRYWDATTGFEAEIGEDQGETVLRLRTPHGVWETALEARAPDLHLAVPRRATADTPPKPGAAEAGGWEFTIRSVADGIVLNDDRTKRLHMARTR
ncbi:MULTISPECIES: serine hydrolase domain-containing protein [Inquilinus]|uniref:CubicO group peptidase (Beta-lactamase class C family) n=1 Tax=Inquilinus ginsengisoli TaxID=363840 RepID=A0ABU1K329_9PROT|nr:serine hydrolase domain-containing protein [Inquilinus ginsengisoli]MDR6294184.1 CubicO group peptidase (beta-lactamase class C family) [Inquilinus ginsengisoli]